MSDPDAALCILEAPCKDNDSDHKPHLLAARAYILKDERNAAMECLEKAGSLATVSNEILLLVAKLYGLSEAKTASEIYTRILFDDPQNIEALLGQSELLAKSKSWDVIVANCNNVIDRYPDHQRARFLHCMALQKLNRFEECLDSAKMMAIAAPESPARVLSQAYFENGDNHAALMAANDS